MYMRILLVIFCLECGRAFSSLQISFSTFFTHKKAVFSSTLKCAFFKHLFYVIYRHKIIKKMCFWGNEGNAKERKNE